MTILRWSLLAAGFGTAMGVSAEPQRRLSVDFDQGQHMKAKGSNAIVDPRSKLTFNATTDKGTKAADRPQVVSKGCFTPPSCLRISMDPSAQGAAKNKIMYSFWSHYKPLPGGEQGRMQIGDEAQHVPRAAGNHGSERRSPLARLLLGGVGSGRAVPSVRLEDEHAPRSALRRQLHRAHAPLLRPAHETAIAKPTKAAPAPLLPY